MLFGRLKKSANWKSSLEVFCLIVKSIWFWFILSVLFVLLAGLAFFIFRDWLGENESFTAAIRNFVLVIAAAIALSNENMMLNGWGRQCSVQQRVVWLWWV